jgi:hypothetical protein
MKNAFRHSNLDTNEEYFWRLHKNNTGIKTILSTMKITVGEAINLAATCLERGFPVDLRQFGSKMLNDMQSFHELSTARINLTGQITLYQLSNYKSRCIINYQFT